MGPGCSWSSPASLIGFGAVPMGVTPWLPSCLPVPLAPPNWTIERTAEYVIPLPTFQVDLKKAYPPYAESDRKNPKTDEQRKQDRRDYEKRLRERRKELGLCACCRSNAIPGTVHCPACTEKRRQMKARHIERDLQSKPETQPIQKEMPDRTVAT